MSSVKKRKVVDERRVIQKKWTGIFFYRGERKTVFLEVQKDASSYEKGKFKMSLWVQPF